MKTRHGATSRDSRDDKARQMRQAATGFDLDVASSRVVERYMEVPQEASKGAVLLSVRLAATTRPIDDFECPCALCQGVATDV
jgi:hypothetical protein